MTAPPEAAKPGYHPVDKATANRLVVDDGYGNALVQQQSSSTQFPPPLLHPASDHSWCLRLGESGVILDDHSSFGRLSKEQMQTRQAFANEVRENLVLLPEIDVESGLVRRVDAKPVHTGCSEPRHACASDKPSLLGVML